MSRLHEVSVDFEVPFHDVDALRIVWHGHYYKYMELGRTALLRACGLESLEGGAMELAARSPEAPRRHLLLVDARCRYTYPLRYGDRGRVSAWFSALTPRLVVSYRIRNLTHDRSSARARSELVLVDADGRMLPETPDDVLEILRG